MDDLYGPEVHRKDADIRTVSRLQLQIQMPKMLQTKVSLSVCCTPVHLSFGWTHGCFPSQATAGQWTHMLSPVLANKQAVEI